MRRKREPEERVAALPSASIVRMHGMIVYAMRTQNTREGSQEQGQGDEWQEEEGAERKEDQGSRRGEGAGCGHLRRSSSHMQSRSCVILRQSRRQPRASKLEFPSLCSLRCIHEYSTPIREVDFATRVKGLTSLLPIVCTFAEQRRHYLITETEK